MYRLYPCTLCHQGEHPLCFSFLVIILLMLIPCCLATPIYFPFIKAPHSPLQLHIHTGFMRFHQAPEEDDHQPLPLPRERH